MHLTRKIHKVFKSKPTLEGAGVHLKRAFGFGETSLFDPFLLLDDFRSDNPEHFRKGFPWHPHRGIETITYVLTGDVEHGDSLGNKGVIGSGDVQWMTAGSGIIHQEMPQGDSAGRMYGFQLWANLPARAKMMDPRYRDVKSAQIPEVKLPQGGVVKIISGTVSGAQKFTISRQPGVTIAGVPVFAAASRRVGPALNTPPTSSSAHSVVVRSSTPLIIPASIRLSIVRPPVPVQ